MGAESSIPQVEKPQMALKEWDRSVSKLASPTIILFEKPKITFVYHPSDLKQLNMAKQQLNLPNSVRNIPLSTRKELETLEGSIDDSTECFIFVIVIGRLEGCSPLIRSLNDGESIYRWCLKTIQQLKANGTANLLLIFPFNNNRTDFKYIDFDKLSTEVCNLWVMAHFPL